MQTGLFVDAQKRTRFFHGVNAVRKVPPFHPRLHGPADGSTSLTADDALRLKSWGFNVVRLGVLWNAVYPGAGQVNTTYLAAVRDIVEMLDAHGIMTLVDMHQDAMYNDFDITLCPDHSSSCPYYSSSCSVLSAILPDARRVT